MSIEGSWNCMWGTSTHLHCQLQGEVESNAEHSFVPSTHNPACPPPSPLHGFIQAIVTQLWGEGLFSVYSYIQFLDKDLILSMLNSFRTLTIARNWPARLKHWVNNSHTQTLHYTGRKEKRAYALTLQTKINQNTWTERNTSTPYILAHAHVIHAVYSKNRTGPCIDPL